MDIIELCFINGIQGRQRSRALATESGTLKPWSESVEGLFGGRRRSRALAMGGGTIKPWLKSAEGLFGGVAGKACLSRLGEGRGRSGVCKFMVSFVL